MFLFSKGEFHCLKSRFVATQKMKFSIKISSVDVTKSQLSAYLVTLTEEILNRKLHFLCSVFSQVKIFNA